MTAKELQIIIDNLPNPETFFHEWISEDISINGIEMEILFHKEIINCKKQWIVYHRSKLINHSIQKIFYDMAYVFNTTFKEATSIEHLKKLKQEVDEAIEKPDYLFEYADCLLALFAAVHKAGYDLSDLINKSSEKLEIIKKRKWKKLPDGEKI